MTRILVLRPEPGASETARRARDAGFDVLAVPLFTIAPMAWVAPDPAAYDALLLTSANAVRRGGDQLRALRDLPVHAVGEVTAMAARAAGFTVASSGEAGVERVLESIDQKLRLLHLCGEDRRAPERAGQKITAIPVYCAATIESPVLDAATGGIALIHSPRAGARFSELVDRDARATMIVAAISAAAARAAGGGWKAVEVAERPDDAALLALAARLCQKSPAP